MQASELLIKTRKFVKDLGKTNYDDYEIFDAINDALSVLTQLSANNGLNYFRKNTTLEPDDELPDDFVKDSHCFDSTGNELFRVGADTPGTGEYSISGNQFKTGATSGTFKLLYFYCPNGISSGDTTVALPKIFVIPIAKAAAYILQSDDNSAVTIAQFFTGATGTSSD